MVFDNNGNVGIGTTAPTSKLEVNGGITTSGAIYSSNAISFVASDGTAKPYRMHIRGPSFSNLQTLPVMLQGGLIADAVAVISSIDPVMGDVDR